MVICSSGAAEAAVYILCNSKTEPAHMNTGPSSNHHLAAKEEEEEKGQKENSGCIKN